jgi:hypothetical protein
VLLDVHGTVAINVLVVGFMGLSIEESTIGVKVGE